MNRNRAGIAGVILLVLLPEMERLEDKRRARMAIGTALVTSDGMMVESLGDWLILPRLIRGLQGLIRGMFSIIAAGTSLIEAIANPGLFTWLIFAYEVASFFFPFLFPAFTTRFAWLDILSGLASLAMMLI